MASAAYELTLKKFLDADVDLLVDTIKARLVRTSAYTFSQAHDFADDLPAAIVADATLGSKTTTAGVFDAADAVFSRSPGRGGDRRVRDLQGHRGGGDVAADPVPGRVLRHPERRRHHAAVGGGEPEHLEDRPVAGG